MPILTGWQGCSFLDILKDPIHFTISSKCVKSLQNLHGDRYCKDDKAIVGGLAKIDNQSVVIIGHQKGE
jgi:acetyl-CoA carboxylase carboxyl transferase subunit alpha